MHRFDLYREKLILKGKDSNPRVISIPIVRDNVVLRLLHFYLREIYSNLNGCSVRSTVRNIKNKIQAEEFDCYLKLDVKNFFPSIVHQTLFNRLKLRVKEPFVLDLLQKAISQNTVALTSTNREKYTNQCGVPQGLSISMVLSSIYLEEIDKVFAQKSNCHYSRYVDDIMILCNKDDISALYSEILGVFAKYGLDLHDMGKDLKKSSSGAIVDGFQFLGHRFKAKHISVRDVSLNKMYERINEVFLKYYKSSEEKDQDYLYWRLNLKITGCIIAGKQYGWIYFFSEINDLKILFKLDSHIKRCCKRFRVSYDRKKIKTFSRAYYEIIKNKDSNYIPCYRQNESVEKNELPISRVFKEFLDLKQKNISIPQKLLGQIQEDLEQDVEFYP